MDAKASRWLSCDPILGDYLPQPAISDEAKKYNKNLPGMGGVFNPVNISLYHYAGNNPLKYTDPDGKATYWKIKDYEASAWRYAADSKLVDIYMSGVGAIPFIGIGVDIANGLNNFVYGDLYDTVDPGNKRQLEKYLGTGASVGTILGYISEAINLFGPALKALKVGSKVLGVLSNIGTAIGIGKFFLHALDFSYKTEKAVELYGGAQDKNLEMAIAKGIFLESVMKVYLEEGIVSIGEDKDGFDKLIWHDEKVHNELDHIIYEGFEDIKKTVD